jgi:hypothetical protein
MFIKLKRIVLEMDGSVIPTHVDREGVAWNGHFDCTCHIPKCDPPPSSTAVMCVTAILTKTGGKRLSTALKDGDTGL